MPKRSSHCRFADEGVEFADVSFLEIFSQDVASCEARFAISQFRKMHKEGQSDFGHVELFDRDFRYEKLSKSRRTDPSSQHSMPSGPSSFRAYRSCAGGRTGEKRG